MTDDHALLEAAARAAGIEVPPDSPWGGIDKRRGVWKDISGGGDGTKFWTWNPLTDDGDALELAVKLRMCVQHDDGAAVLAGWVYGQNGAPTRDGTGPWYWKEWLADNSDNRATATRRAIVRAAAALAKATP